MKFFEKVICKNRKLIITYLTHLSAIPWLVTLTELTEAGTLLADNEPTVSKVPFL